MKRVLVALVGVSAFVAAGFAAAAYLTPTGMLQHAERFLTVYSSNDPLGGAGLVTVGFGTNEPGSQAQYRRLGIRRHLGAFKRIEKVLVERLHRLGNQELGEVQCLAAFEKGQALVRLRLLQMEGHWRVSVASIDIPPALMKRTPKEFAAMFSMQLVKLWSAGDANSVRRMGTDVFRAKISEGVLKTVMLPLLTTRDKLNGLGAVVSEATGPNERDLRILATYEIGDPLGFDIMLRWVRNRWHVTDLRVSDAFGEVIPPGARRDPSEFQIRMKAPNPDTLDND